MDWLARHDAAELTAVAIAPDLGERYLDTVYQTNWVQDLYGDDVLRAGRPIDAAPATAGTRVTLPPAASSRGLGATVLGEIEVPLPAPERARSRRRHRVRARRGAGRRPGRRAGAGRRALLRRPGRRLDGHGPLLRPGPQARRPALGLDQGRLPAPDRSAAWRPHARLAAVTAPDRRRRAQEALAEVLAEVLGSTGVGRRHFFDDLGADSMLMARFCARVRKRADLPSVSIKDVYQHPTIRQPGHGASPPPPIDPVEGALAELLAEVIEVESVPVDSHFFDDLGADSLVMAQFCARVRKRADLPSVSMKDVYQHPTIAEPGGGARTPAPAAVAAATPASTPADPARTEAPVQASTLEYVLCGALQLLFFLGYPYLAALVVERLRVDRRRWRSA